MSTKFTDPNGVADRSVYTIKGGQHGFFGIDPTIDLSNALVFAKDRTGAEERIRIMEHPNAYSLDALAVRIVKAWETGDVAPVLAQYDFIVECGGEGMTREAIESIASGHIDQAFEVSAPRM